MFNKKETISIYKKECKRLERERNELLERLNSIEDYKTQYEEMLSDVKRLKNDETIHCPTYDYTHFCRAEKTDIIEPKQVIILEGILLFENKELADLLDIKIFVDTDADVRILRRILRDVKERGRSLDSIVNQYLTTVKPTHEQFIEPSKKIADIIVPEGGHNDVAFDIIYHTILERINDKKE